MSPLDEEPAGRTDEDDGPSTWLVVVSTLAAAALVAAALVGWRAWSARDDETTGETTATATTAEPTTPPPSDTLGAGEAGLLFSRTTEAGVELRAERMRWDGIGGPAIDVIGGPAAPGNTAEEGSDPADADADGNGTPDICEPIGDIVGWAITDDEIVQGSTPWTLGRVDRAYPSPMMNWLPESRLLGVVVQVDASTRRVHLQGPAGASDEMVPVDGVAVLAVAVPAGAVDDAAPEAAFELVRLTTEEASGRATTLVTDRMWEGHPAWSMTGPCAEMNGRVVEETAVPVPVPNVELPDPGPRQPDDVAAAEAGIHAAFTAVGDRSLPIEQRVAAIDDPYGMSDALRKYDDSGVSMPGGSGVAIGAIVFVDADHAVFQVGLDSGTDEETFWTAIGRARFVDGAWKLTRSTVCMPVAEMGICPA